MNSASFAASSGAAAASMAASRRRREELLARRKIARGNDQLLVTTRLSPEETAKRLIADSPYDWEEYRADSEGAEVGVKLPQFDVGKFIFGFLLIAGMLWFFFFFKNDACYFDNCSGRISYWWGTLAGFIAGMFMGVNKGDLFQPDGQVEIYRKDGITKVLFHIYDDDAERYFDEDEIDTFLDNIEAIEK